MAKLHELLAVQKNLDNQSAATRKELSGTFTNKRNHFVKSVKTFTSKEEGGLPVTEEQSDIQTSVIKEIDWISDKIMKAIDVGHQIDMANTISKSDVILDNGDTLLKDIPATSLLQLEKRLAEVSELIKTIPTLDPAKGFTTDTEQGGGIYKAREVTKTRTAMEPKVITLAPATDKFPANVQLVNTQVAIGIIREQEWSSLITVAQKGALLDNVEELQRAVKKARARANEVEIDVATTKVGKKMLDYIFNPLKVGVAS